MKAIIAGGGIGGLTAALALTRVGVEAEVFERAAELREVGAGIALAENALQVLDLLGLGAAVRAEGFAGIPGLLRTPSGRTLAEVKPDATSAGITGAVVIHRSELLALLAGQVGLGRIHTGFELEGFEQAADGVTVRFGNGEAVKGDVLIGADGVRSRVSAQLFGTRKIRYAGYSAWRAVTEFAAAEKWGIGETWGRGCRFGIAPMSRGRVYWYATRNCPEGGQATAKDRESLLRLFNGWHEPVEDVIRATPAEAILRNDLGDMDPLTHWTQGRVCLLGDAAHPMTPNLGQGACQAIEDAVVLAVCLKSASTVNEGLAAYQRRRIPRTREIVLGSRRVGQLGQWENGLLCRVRDTLMRITPKGIAASQAAALIGFDLLDTDEKKTLDRSLN